MLGIAAHNDHDIKHESYIKNTYIKLDSSENKAKVRKEINAS